MKITEVFTPERIKELLAMPMVHGGHHIAGSSSMGRLALCSGAAFMALDNIEVDTSNEDSDAGTEKHKAIEDTIVDALNSGVAPVGDHTEAAYKAVKAAIDGLKEAGWTIKSVDSEKTLLPKGIGQGTLDILITATKEGKGELWYDIDFKTGVGACATEATRWQLLDHARLCFDNGASIYYGNCFSTERGEWLYDAPFKYRKASGDDIRVRESINEVIDYSLDPEKARLCPSDEACKYCRGALSGKCPAFVAQNREAFSAIVPHEDVSVFAAIELIKRGHVTPAMSAKIDEGKVLLKRAQDYLDGLKNELDGAVKTLGGTEKYAVVTRKAGVKVDYKACWQSVKDKIPNFVIVEQNNSKPTAESVSVTPRQRKTSTDAGVAILPATNTDTPSVVEKGATDEPNQANPQPKENPAHEETAVSPTVAPVVAPSTVTEPPVKARKERADKGKPRGPRVVPQAQQTLDGGPIGEIQAGIIREIEATVKEKVAPDDVAAFYQTYRAKIGKELSQMNADELRAMALEASQL